MRIPVSRFMSRTDREPCGVRGMSEQHRSGRKALSWWVAVTMIVVVVAVGAVYTFLPMDDLRAFFGMEHACEKTEVADSWNSLTPAQKASLAPLENTWGQLSAAQKRKWLAVARKMEHMSPEKRERFQNHIRDWLNLTPEQRRLARQNYLGFRKLDPEHKSQKWQEYQRLPEEKKRALAERARTKRRLTRLDGEQKDDTVVEPIRQRSGKSAHSQDEMPEYWR